MSKKTGSEVDNFLADLEGGEQNPFEPAADPFVEKPEEEVKEDESASESEEAEDAKPEPFHKDPKVQKYVQKQIDKALDNFKPEIDVSEVQKFVKESGADEDELVAAFTGLIGNDTPEKLRVLKAVKTAFQQAEEKGAQKALEQLEAQREQMARADREAEDELSDGFETIEEQFEVDLTSNTPMARKTRNEFIDFVKRIAPKDEDGQVTEFPDFAEAYTVFQETKKSDTKNPTTNRAKELASKSMGRSSGDSPAPASTDKSWNAVDKLFSKFIN